MSHSIAVFSGFHQTVYVDASEHVAVVARQYLVFELNVAGVAQVLAVALVVVVVASEEMRQSASYEINVLGLHLDNSVAGKT